jgi:hypothetical protein
MLAKNRNDFRVFEEETMRGKKLWVVRIGGSKGTVITCLNSLDEATETARQLNLDPWFLSRGQTRKDRADQYL